MSSIEIFPEKIGVRPARIDPLTHDWRLAAVLFTGPALLSCYHVGFYAYCLYRSGYRFKLQSLLNITRYVVLVFPRIFHWFLTYAPRLRDRAEGGTGGPPSPPPPLFCKNKINLAKIYLLHREGGTIFVSDQLSQKVKRAVNLRAYRQNINKLALIMDFYPPPLQMCPILATKKALQEDWNGKVFFLIFFFRFCRVKFWSENVYELSRVAVFLKFKKKWNPYEEF